MSLRKPQFVTHNSESSLIYESRMRKRAGSSSPSDRHDKMTPRFVDKSPLLPTKTTKVAVFNSSGEKTDNYYCQDLLSTSFIKIDNESLYTSPSDYLIGRGYDLENWAQTDTIGEPEKNEKSPRRDHAQETDIQPKLKRQLSKYQMKRNRTKTLMSRKRRSKTDIKHTNQVRPFRNNKETSTESVPRSNAKTQTEQKLWTNCRKCIQQNTDDLSPKTQHIIEPKDPTNLKPSPGMVKKNTNQKGNNDFSAAEKLNLNSIRLNLNGSESSRASSRTGSFVDLNKNIVNTSRHLTNDAIHQEIMKLKKNSTRNSPAIRKITALDKTLPLSNVGYLYQEIQKAANKNGSLRIALSMLVFGILLFWLISSIFHFGFILGIFRSIGRYLSTFSVFLTGRKKQTSKSEIASKYAGIFFRFVRTLLVGTPNPGR